MLVTERFRFFDFCQKNKEAKQAKKVKFQELLAKVKKANNSGLRHPVDILEMLSFPTFFDTLDFTVFDPFGLTL